MERHQGSGFRVQTTPPLNASRDNYHCSKSQFPKLTQRKPKFSSLPQSIPHGDGRISPSFSSRSQTPVPQDTEHCGQERSDTRTRTTATVTSLCKGQWTPPQLALFPTFSVCTSSTRVGLCSTARDIKVVNSREGIGQPLLSRDYLKIAGAAKQYMAGPFDPDYKTRVSIRLVWGPNSPRRSTVRSRSRTLPFGKQAKCGRIRHKLHVGISIMRTASYTSRLLVSSRVSCCPGRAIPLGNERHQEWTVGLEEGVSRA